jgi:hypothetical protein
MKSFVINSLPLLFLFVAVVACSDTQKATSKEDKPVVVPYNADVDNPLMMKTLEDFIELGVNSNGPKASKLLLKPSLDYYVGLKQAVFSETKEQVQARSFVDQVIIMRIRIKADMEILAKLDSLQFTEYIYRSGYVDKSSIQYHSMGEITYNEETKEAKAPVLIKGEAKDGYYTFKKENNVWKVDISEAIPHVNQQMEDDISDNGGSPAYMLNLVLLSANSGKELSEQLWGPQR